MGFRNIKNIVAAICILASTSAWAAAHKLMQLSAVQAQPAVEAGKAQIVFMRPSNYAGPISATVYDVTNGEIRFLGVLGPKDKMSVAVEPGAHRYMVVAENADFMEATVDAGAVYFAIIRARMGVWKARFSLIPIQSESADQYNLNHPEFKSWRATGEWVEPTARATQWYEENKDSVREKHDDYMTKWREMLPEDKAELTMGVEDGIRAGQP